jgi:hypothetical protein
MSKRRAEQIQLTLKRKRPPIIEIETLEDVANPRNTIIGKNLIIGDKSERLCRGDVFPQYINQVLSKKLSLLLLAFKDEQLSGIIMCNRKKDHTLTLEVWCAAEGSGVGKQLHDQMVEWAKSKRIKSIHAATINSEKFEEYGYEEDDDDERVDLAEQYYLTAMVLPL